MMYIKSIAVTTIGVAVFLIGATPAFAQMYYADYGPNTSFCDPSSYYAPCASGVGGLFGAGGLLTPIFSPNTGSSGAYGGYGYQQPVNYAKYYSPYSYSGSYGQQSYYAQPNYYQQQPAYYPPMPYGYGYAPQYGYAQYPQYTSYVPPVQYYGYGYGYTGSPVYTNVY